MHRTKLHLSYLMISFPPRVGRRCVYNTNAAPSFRILQMSVCETRERGLSSSRAIPSQPELPSTDGSSLFLGLSPHTGTPVLGSHFNIHLQGLYPVPHNRFFHQPDLLPSSFQTLGVRAGSLNIVRASGVAPIPSRSLPQCQGLRTPPFSV